MDVEALLEASQDFEKKETRETCPILEQFLCHVAKTGQTLISWSHFKMYFMYKLEKVIEDFHDSTPEQRSLHNPNIEHIPFEEMKERILKIVDSYNGIPFTIQRLCELLMDPKRNYTGTDKFLRGLEKNVMVVSCVYPTSEKNGSSGNRMNGVKFPGNSTQSSDSQNLNGPGSPKPFSRLKLSLCSKLSSNGLPDCPLSKDSEVEEEEEQQHISEPSLTESKSTQYSRTKNKHPVEEEEEEEEEESDSDSRQEVKRRKFQEKEEIQTTSKETEFSALEKPESPSETSTESRGQDDESRVVLDISDNQEPSSSQTEPSERDGDVQDGVTATDGENSDSSTEQRQQPPSSLSRTSVEQDDVNNNLCTSPDVSTEGSADGSKRDEPGEHREHDCD
ncbi:serine/threonine-protein phosphatase 4 regulatory subunit 2-like [Gouania willdenowi]|uniref:Serine/threonine-protein phosphatase 4 regulatory subunit 2-like n=1 Tax=Gouania willdenowi TaxID=441366 RepID=A0A8C5D0G8_GOUWI|nr:serine/threonine-protein phosphatase 4 regulatory subunit 2-like [Gouania willdenowi]